MASNEFLHKLNTAQKDFVTVVNAQSFNQIKNNSVLFNPWIEARDLALKWMVYAKPVLSRIDDSSLAPLLVFAQDIIGIADGRVRGQNEAIPDVIRRVTSQFRSALPLLAFELLAASGVLDLSEGSLRDWKERAVVDFDTSLRQATESIKSLVAQTEANLKATAVEADTTLKASAVEAGKDFELAKAKASKISVDSAQKQFIAADREFRNKSAFWNTVTIISFGTLVVLLVCFLRNPPRLIQSIVAATEPGSKAIPLPVSVPLLIAASAYFTSLRLAVVGVVGAALAFSLRMMRVYFHMIEHNQHKLRVTNSIEAFVAAVRTNEQKDLVLAKLVESVTEFGDPGILGKEEKPTGLPSVIFEAVTKNVGKID